MRNASRERGWSLTSFAMQPTPSSLRPRRGSNRSIVIGVTALLLLGAGFVWWLRRAPEAAPPISTPVVETKKPDPAVRRDATGAAVDPSIVTIRPPPPKPAVRTLTAAEKEARIAQIKRDYDEIRAKISADYSALAATFPGGLNGFLKQLALLEREKRKDFASFLDGRELETLELQETNAGQLIRKHLGDTGASDEQVRAAFRLQRDFEDRFALTFDLTPAALLERETARQATQERIRAEIGDQLFAQWLRGEGGDFAQFQQFGAEHGLPAAAAFELWRAKNEYTRRRLELNTQRDQAPSQAKTAQQALIQQTETRIFSIVGPGAMGTARQQILGWLPRG